MKSTFIFILVFALVVTVNFAFSKTIFQDDFEKDKVGNPPSRWVGCSADGQIFEDPLKRGNLVMGVIKQNVDCGVLADTDVLSEYIVEWDWMWQNAEWHSMTIHQEKPGENYHFSRNPDANAWEMWVRTGGNWPGPFVVGKYATDLNKWYRCQFTVNKADIAFKIKEKDDNTPFDKIKSVVEMRGEDDRFKKGKFGVNENPGSFLDNVLIYIGKPSPVEGKGKLTTTWCRIKSRLI
ncbi:hypothetical protein FJZ31_26960 [Candidatus Poribacteria bacterium]|nr:hypothetical protein [Candidatus Poribacteria bacterium]